jgi:hypothetical protein
MHETVNSCQYVGIIPMTQTPYVWEAHVPNRWGIGDRRQLLGRGTPSFNVMPPRLALPGLVVKHLRLVSISVSALSGQLSWRLPHSSLARWSYLALKPWDKQARTTGVYVHQSIRVDPADSTLADTAQEHNAYRDMPRDMENMTAASVSRLPC